VHKDENAVVFARADTVTSEIGALTAAYASATDVRLEERRAWSWQYPLERVMALRSYAELNFVLGDVTTALGIYDELLELDLSRLDETEVLYRYGYHLATRGDANRARWMLDRARELSPDDVRLSRLLESIGARR
jgi:hypothetical protein